MADIRESFDRRVRRDAETGCWIWSGNAAGRYGLLYVGGGSAQLAHRVAWELFRGAIPDGMCVLHNCPSGDNTRCVNPDHLFLGTSRDNTRDMLRKGRARPRRGERHPEAKLTDAIVQDMRTRRARGASIRSIARDLDVDYKTAWNALHAVSWKHVEARRG